MAVYGGKKRSASRKRPAKRGARLSALTPAVRTRFANELDRLREKRRLSKKDEARAKELRGRLRTPKVSVSKKPFKPRKLPAKRGKAQPARKSPKARKVSPPLSRKSLAPSTRTRYANELAKLRAKRRPSKKDVARIKALQAKLRGRKPARPTKRPARPLRKVAPRRLPPPPSAKPPRPPRRRPVGPSLAEIQAAQAELEEERRQIAEAQEALRREREELAQIREAARLERETLEAQRQLQETVARKLEEGRIAFEEERRIAMEALAREEERLRQEAERRRGLAEIRPQSILFVLENIKRLYDDKQITLADRDRMIADAARAFDFSIPDMYSGYYGYPSLEMLVQAGVVTTEAA